MRLAILLMMLTTATTSYAQVDDRITTIDFVQVLNGNRAEALYYYQNNWQLLRDMAVEKGYIHSYQLLEAPSNEDQPFQFILITTYTNEEGYDLREEHFGELIAERGDLNLMNDKKPGDFRKTLFSKTMVRHWN